MRFIIDRFVGKGNRLAAWNPSCELPLSSRFSRYNINRFSTHNQAQLSLMGGTKRKDGGGGSTTNLKAAHATTQACHPGAEKKQKVQDSTGTGSIHYMASFQVLASDVEHNSPSLLLNIDKFGKICFNAGEGLQRLVRENKVRLQKLEHYLFTRVHTSTLAGLPGMLLRYYQDPRRSSP